MNYIATLAESVYTGTLFDVEDSQSVRSIQTQLLNGQHTVQTIGSAAKRLNVTFYCSRSTRRQIEQVQAESAYIKIYWMNRVWTGLISSKGFKIAKWSRNIVDAEEQIQFEVLVTEEGTR